MNIDWSKASNQPRPRAETIRQVIEHLETLGLGVYGDAIDLDTGEEFDGCRDYSAGDVVLYRSLVERGKTWSKK